MLLLLVVLLTRLAISLSVEGIDDPMSYLGTSMKNCHNSLLLHVQEPDSHRQDKGHSDPSNFIAYLYLYQSCFEEVWTFCLFIDNIKVFDPTNIKSYNPCYGIHVSAYGRSAGFVHDISTRPTFQINLTFTEFVLRQSYAGCTKHYIQVWYTRYPHA